MANSKITKKNNNNSKKIKKELSKFSNKTKIICAFLFLIFLFAGVFTTYYFTKDDKFELIGETEIELNINDVYQDQGAKIIAFGKDISEEVVIKGLDKIDTSKENIFVLEYTVNNFRFKNYKLYRKITVKEVTNG